ncbi:hypothetical protein [Burkholderia gladioli]|uniref:hypothetical protein n=1 Tax=Burkholderia gladioli TaxID=28095 RepID=UPI003D1D503F
MADVDAMISTAQLGTHRVCNLLEVLLAALPEDAPDALPVRSTLKHILDLAKQLPGTLDAIEMEVVDG